MGSVEVVEVLPLLELVVEELGVVDDDAVEEPVTFSASMRCDRSTFPLSRGVRGFDVGVSNAAVQHVPLGTRDWNSEPLSVWMTST